MRALILAAGRGSRMKDLTRNRPKCLLPLAGSTVYDLQLGVLRRSGFDKIAVVTGYRATLLRRAGIRAFHNPEWSETNMVYSFFRAAPLFDEALLVSYGDIIYSPGVVETILCGRGDIRVVSDRNWKSYFRLRAADPYSAAESFRADARGRILDLGRSNPTPKDVHGQYVGLLYFTRRGLAQAMQCYRRFGGDKSSLRRAFMTDFLRLLIESGRAIHATEIRGQWLEFDSARDYRIGQTLLRRNRIPGI